MRATWRSDVHSGSAVRIASVYEAVRYLLHVDVEVIGPIDERNGDLVRSGIAHEPSTRVKFSDILALCIRTIDTHQIGFLWAALGVRIGPGDDWLVRDYRANRASDVDGRRSVRGE